MATEHAATAPRGWTSALVAQVGAVRLGRQRSPDKHTGQSATPYLRAANIGQDGLDLTDVLQMDFTPAERVVFALQTGDLVLAEASGSAAQVGRAALWRGELPGCCFQNTVIRFRPHAVTPEFALIVMRHYAVSGVFARAARGVGILHLGGARFAELSFPVPPAAEQRRIAESFETRRAELREAEHALRSALAHLNEQRREILVASVAGTLVPQEPGPADSEPAPDASADHAPAEPGHGQTAAARGRRSRGRADQPTLFAAAEISTPARGAPLSDEAATTPRGWRWARVDEVGEVTLGMRARAAGARTGGACRGRSRRSP